MAPQLPPGRKSRCRTVGPGEVLVRVLGAGICAGDAKCFSGAPLFWGDDYRQGYCQPPITPGHEFVGEVVALGEGAAEKYGLALGDHAISEQIVPCWECRFCHRGQYWMCDRKHDVYGFRQRTPGAMAEYMLFPADAINHKVPKTLTTRQAVYIEPLACAIHAVQRGNIELGDTVVVAGCGPLGLGMVATAHLKHPGLLIALDPHPNRLEGGAPLRRRPGDEPGRDGCGGRGAQTHRWVRLRRLHRSHRARRGRAAGPAYDPPPGYFRGVQCVQ